MKEVNYRSLAVAFICAQLISVILIRTLDLSLRIAAKQGSSYMER